MHLPIELTSKVPSLKQLLSMLPDMTALMTICLFFNLETLFLWSHLRGAKIMWILCKELSRKVNLWLLFLRRMCCSLRVQNLRSRKSVWLTSLKIASSYCRRIILRLRCWGFNSHIREKNMLKTSMNLRVLTWMCLTLSIWKSFTYWMITSKCASSKLMKSYKN